MIKNITYSLVAAALIVSANCADLTVVDLSKTMLFSDIKTEKKKEWSAEVSSSYSVSNIRTNDRKYEMIPISITLSHAMDEVSLTGWRRGYTEFFGSAYYTFLKDSPESRIAGFNFGPRYNFVQEGWFLIPYIESNVGLAFTDSQPSQRGFGQDFCFEFAVGGGVKYMLTKDVYLRTGLEYIHYSNGGLSEPHSLNNPIDAVGAKVGIGFQF